MVPQFVNTNDYASFLGMKLGFQQIHARTYQLYVCASSTEVDLWTYTVIHVIF
jgi:hypothetical protein